MPLKRLYLALILLTGSLLGGCKVTEPTPPRVSAALPPAFGPLAPTDSVSLAEQPWRTFFQDPQLVGLIDTHLADAD